MAEAPNTGRLRRWAAPLACALVITALVFTLRADDLGRTHSAPGDAPHTPGQQPRFEVSARGTERVGEEPAWFTVSEEKAVGEDELVQAVKRPPSAGRVRGIVAAPDGSFVLVTTRVESCESRLYRVRLGPDGHVALIEPIEGGAVPSLVAGLAISPDGRRLAFGTAPCAPSSSLREPRPAAPPRAALTVLDTATGDRRTWTTSDPSFVGLIMWGGDGRTLGYALGFVSRRPDPHENRKCPRKRMPQADYRITDVVFHTLDTQAPGTGLRTGSVLFRAPPDAVLVRVVMNPDGRSGRGVMRRYDPPSKVSFTFEAGGGMRVTNTSGHECDAQIRIAAKTRPPACLNGIDAFGRAEQGFLRDRGPFLLYGLPICNY